MQNTSYMDLTQSNSTAWLWRPKAWLHSQMGQTRLKMPKADSFRICEWAWFQMFTWIMQKMFDPRNVLFGFQSRTY